MRFFDKQQPFAKKTSSNQHINLYKKKAQEKGRQKHWHERREGAQIRKCTWDQIFLDYEQYGYKKQFHEHTNLQQPGLIAQDSGNCQFQFQKYFAINLNETGSLIQYLCYIKETALLYKQEFNIKNGIKMIMGFKMLINNIQLKMTTPDSFLICFNPDLPCFLECKISISQFRINKKNEVKMANSCILQKQLGSMMIKICQLPRIAQG